MLQNFQETIESHGGGLIELPKYAKTMDGYDEYNAKECSQDKGASQASKWTTLHVNLPGKWRPEEVRDRT